MIYSLLLFLSFLLPQNTIFCEADSLNWIEYNSEVLSFSYPDIWIMKENEANDKEGMFGFTYSFFDKNETVFQEENLTAQLSWIDFSNLGLSDETLYSFVTNMVSKQVNNLDIILLQDSTFTRFDTKVNSITYVNVGNTRSFKEAFYAWSKNQRGFLFTFSGNAVKFDEMQDIYKRMFNSITLAK